MSTQKPTYQDLENKIKKLVQKTEYLQETNFLYQNVINNLPFGIQIFDKKGFSYKINKKQKELLGLPNLDEGIGKFNVLNDPYSKAVGADKIYEKAYLGEGYHHEFEYNLGIEENKWNTKNGKRIFNETIIPIQKNKEVEFVLATLNDVTGKRESEEKLKQAKEKAEESQEKFSTIFNMSQSLVCIADINTASFKFINPSFSKVLGYADEELLSKSFTEFIHPEDVKPTLKIVNKELKAGNPVIHFENRYRHQDGSYRWLSWNSFPVPEKGITYAIAHDVTIIKETEKELNQKNEEYAAVNEELRQTNDELLASKSRTEFNESKFRNLFNSLASAIFIYHPETYQIIEANEATSRIYGYTPDELVGMSCLKFSAEADKSKSVNSAAKEQQKQFVNFRHHKRKDETLVFVQLFVHKLSIDNEDYMFAVSDDITEKIKSESIIKQNNQRLQILLDLNEMNDVEINDIYDFALEKAVQLCDSKIGFLGFLNEKETIVSIHAWSASVMKSCEVKDKYIDFVVEKTGIWGEVIRQRKPVMINDFKKPNPLKRGTPKGHVKIENYLGIPVFDNGKITAVLAVGNKETSYTETDIRELTLLMKGMWNMVKRKLNEQEIIKEKEKTEKQNIHIQHLYGAAKQVLYTEDFTSTAKKIFDSCKEITGAASGYVALLNDEGEENELLFLDSGGMPCSVDESLPMPIRGLRGEAYQLSKAVYHNDFMNSDHIKYMPVGHVILKNVMFAPLFVGEKAVGLIGLANKASDFTEEDIKSVMPFAELASIALKNAKYHEALISAKEKAEESEQKFRTLFDKLNDGITLTHKGKIVDINEFMVTRLGFENKEQAIGRSLFDFMTKESKELAKLRAQKLEQSHSELSYQSTTGEEFTVEMLGTEINFDGKLYGLNVHRDITDRKRATERAKILAEMLDVAPNSITIHDKEGKFLYVNKKTFEIHGYSQEEFISLKLHDIDVPKSQALITERMALIEKQGHATFESEHYKKDGSIFTLEVFAKKVFWHNKPVILSIATDITKRKELTNQIIAAKENAEESEFKVRGMFKSTEMGLIFCNSEGQILEVNKAIIDILGSPSIEATKRINLLTFKSLTEAGFSGKLQQSIDERKTLSGDIHYKSKWGVTVFMRYQLIPLVVRDKLIGVWINLSNLTDLWNNKKELIKAKEKAEESSRLKSAFLQNLSHEIRTPLNAVCGFSGMLNDPNISEKKRESFIPIIQNSSDQLLSVVSDILAISSLETKQEELHIEETNINGMLIELLAKYKNSANNHNISIYSKRELNNEQSIIRTDKDKLLIILNCLLSNAFKFTHEGIIEFGYTQNKHELEFYVKDSGIGIPRKQHGKVFEAFRQAGQNIQQNYGGTGLGLSIAKGYTELLGGKIWFESQEGKGSVFHFTIPYKPVNENAIILKNSDSDTKKRKTVVVAEDEGYNYLLIEELLIDMDVDVIHAKNGQEAVDICSKNPNINLVLMDIKMPVMDGYTAAKIIKERNPELPIIAQTAYGLEKEIERYQDIFDDYLPKPLESENLLSLVRSFIFKTD